MKTTVTVNVKFTEEELVKFIGDRVVPLEDDEDWELVSSYPSLNNYTFRIIKKDTGDDSEEH